MTTSRSKEFKPIIALSNKDDVLIDFNQRITEWAYGPIYRGHIKKQNKTVMVKVIDLKKFPLPRSCLDTEIKLLKKLHQNKYIVKFAEYRYYENTLTITTDICNKGSLRAHLQKRGALPEAQALPFLLQILHGLKALHDLGYSHGAVRPENVLLHEEDGNLSARLSTLVFAKPYSTEPVNRAQLPYDSLYLSPEILKGLNNNPKTDLWSLGVLYYEMLYGRTPWTGADMKELESHILTDKLEFPTDINTSEASTSFISRCLERDSSKRMSWNEAVQHRLVFRGMFSKGNGTYRVLNEEFKEETPLSGRLMYGLRRENTNTSMSSHSRALSFNKSTAPSLKAIFETADAGVNMTHMRRSSAAETCKTQGPEEEEALSPKSPIQSAIKSVGLPLQSPLKRSMTARHHPTKSLDGRFYQELVSTIGTPDETFALKTMSAQKSSRVGGTPYKAQTTPFRQLSFKAEMLGEICQLMQENQEHPLYDKISKVLENESQKLNNSVMNITNITQNFKEKLEKSVKKVLNSTNGSSSARVSKVPQSVPRKIKSKEIQDLLREILTNLILGNKGDPNVNEKGIISIAANLKVLREFEEIGEDVSKKLKSLKDMLHMFYRQRNFDHLKYLILVKNLV